MTVYTDLHTLTHTRARGGRSEGRTVCRSEQPAAAAFLTQYQRATVHRDEARKQFAKNHYCGMNCKWCGGFECDACNNCPELMRGGFCDDTIGTCERKPDDIVAYAEALADWVCEFHRKREER